MKHHTAKRLLQETPLSVTDAVRLILEGMEDLGEHAAGLARGDCLKLLRRMTARDCSRSAGFTRGTSPTRH